MKELVDEEEILRRLGRGISESAQTNDAVTGSPGVTTVVDRSAEPQSATSGAAVRRKDDSLPADSGSGMRILAPSAASKHEARLIVVANRLPLSLKKDATTGEYTFKMSSGGLVSALVSVRDKQRFTWCGWLGTEVPAEDQQRIRDQLWREHECVPVFLPESIADPFYNGLCNAELWPRFHYEDTGKPTFDTDQWEAYKQANVEFAKVSCAEAAISSSSAAALRVRFFQCSNSLHSIDPASPECRPIGFLLYLGCTGTLPVISMIAGDPQHQRTGGQRLGA